MSLTLNPPPMQLPGDFASDKVKNAFFTALLNTVYQIWTALFNIRQDATVDTTDNKPAVLFSAVIDPGHTVMLDTQIVARRSGGSAGASGDSAFFKVTGCYKNVGGALVGVGAPNTIGSSDQGTWGVNFTSSGGVAFVTVTGATNNNISWVGEMSLYDVGTEG